MLYLHVDIMNFLSSCQFRSFADFQDEATQMRRSWTHYSVEAMLLFQLQDYYVLKRFRRKCEMWQRLDQIIKTARAYGTAHATAVRALALAWKSYASLGCLKLQYDETIYKQGLEALFELLELSDQTSLSNVVCAEVKMAIGFWNEKYQAWPGTWDQAEKFLLQTLTHYARCGFVEELANDGIKLCRIQVQKHVPDGIAAFYEVRVVEAQMRMNRHLQTVHRQGLQRFSERSSIRCLGTLILGCC